jgi:hypothetical protein
MQAVRGDTTYTESAVMRYKQTNERRAVILMVVLSLLTLFAIVGITFVLYADAEAASARVAREAETQQRADVDPQQALSFFLSQFIYDVPDATGYSSGLRGHSLARTMYGYNSATANLNAFDGIGRLHYQGALNQDDYTLVNYTWFSTDGFIRFPERYNATPGNSPANAANYPYVGGNAPYTYPDLNNFFLAAVTANGTVLTPSFHRPWLFGSLAQTNPNWTNVQGKYLTLRPRPNEHPNFPMPDDPNGDVKNLVWAPGGNDSIWIDIGAPVMTAPDGTLYKMLVAPLIMDLDGRINLGSAGNILGPNNSHVSNMGLGGWEVNLGKILYADNATAPVEWINLFLGKAMPGGNTVYGKYGANGAPSTPGTNAPSGTPAHTYAQGDVNGLNETTPASPSSRPAPPGFGGTATYGFPLFAQGYLNGGTELTNHPLLYNMFRPAWYNNTDDRIFHASDMESLLRPNMLTNPSPVDANSSAVFSDLIRLCPTNFGPGAASPRYRNLVTTLSMDLGVPGVSPYWWNTMPATSYLTVNANNLLLPPSGQTVPFPTLPPTAAIANTAGTNPPTSEFDTNWQALSANTISYLLTANPAGPPPYTTPGARIRLNRPLPPYPHMGVGVTPPYTSQPPNAISPYGVAYNLTTAAVANQYQAALSARQALANDIYRRLLATAGLPAPVAPATPTNLELAPRRWLAQLAVNIVDFIDEDDINTPFNFYTTQDNNNQPLAPPAPTAPNPAGTQGPDDNAATGNPATTATGANPDYWVFGTELPKVVLNEVLAEATNPSTAAAAAATESVKVWLELFNTMQATPAPATNPSTNTQPQDSYRVPLYMTLPGGAAGGYSPYRITIAQTLMNRPPPTFTIANPAPAGSALPDTSANVLGKANVAAPFPQSTTDVDFSAVVPLSQNLTNPPPATAATQAPFTVPVSGNIINAGVDPQNFFLIGPKTVAAPYQNPFVSPGLPNNIPVLQTDSVSYTPTATSWPAAGTTDERTTGLTVMLRRLANPYLPLQTNPGLPNYNPYLTVDYISNVPIQSNTPAPAAAYTSWGKTQPYAGLTQVTVTAGVPQAPANSTALAGSPVTNQLPNAAPPPAGAASPAGVFASTTFGYANYPLPPSGHYDWLVHLDRPPISPMELLHVSAWPPYMLTQRFMLGSNSAAVNAAATPPSLNTFGHYAPWFDALPPGQTLATMVCPWWFDASLPPLTNPPTAANTSHRLYRLFEFLESGDWATGVNGLGRIPGKVNINTIWDPEILQALVDANTSIGITASPSQYPPNAADPIVTIFKNLIQSRSPNAQYNVTTGIYGGSIGAVNMGTASGDDRPFLPLSAGLSAGGTGTQYPNGVSVTTDTLLRTYNAIPGKANPLSPTLLLFQNTLDRTTSTTSGHPYLQTQLLTKLYNKVTTRSNTFAVFLTVGFFQVTNPATTPPTLGPEIGRSEGRQIRHRMFAIVDRTNLSAFSSSSSTAVTGPTLAGMTPNPTGNQTITLNGSLPATIQAGSQLVIEPGTANEETVVVQSFVQAAAGPPATPATITANFTKQHPNPTLTGNPSTTYTVIQRGNPGPQTNYDPRSDPLVVPYFSIID